MPQQEGSRFGRNRRRAEAQACEAEQTCKTSRSDLKGSANTLRPPGTWYCVKSCRHGDTAELRSVFTAKR